MSISLLLKGGLPQPLSGLEAAIGVGTILAGVCAAAVLAGVRALLRRRAARPAYPNVKA